jgi:tetratricopeptide (TPR) repeat protein
MKTESLALAVATAFFGLLAGWMIGSQQARPAPAAATSAAPAQSPAPDAGPTPKLVDETQVQALKNAADRDPRNAGSRVELGNLYFDAERYDEAIKWYEEALKLDPKNADISTDLGVSYYYLNQPDRALKQFDYSLSVNPTHTKTMLNMGVVRAFGKQDLDGAMAVWKKLIELSPGSAEGQAAQRALDSLKSAHPNLGEGAAPPKTGSGA